MPLDLASKQLISQLIHSYDTESRTQAHATLNWEHWKLNGKTVDELSAQMRTLVEQSGALVINHGSHRPCPCP
jgi:hypothetical protein